MDDLLKAGSFTAKVYCDTPGYQGALSHTSSGEPGQSGWLVRRGGSGGTLELCFNYLEHTADRIHYRITAAPGGDYGGAGLGVSARGYLGFYHLACVGFWKVEVLEYDEQAQAFSFSWRDQWGHRVSITQEGLTLKPAYPGARPTIAQYLCIGREGAWPLQFRAEL
ncbi:hypothetical protein [Pseudomonas sp.]|uniref:hypothetical protein n=1 Tax=Pseudomonas sp. TaxID=306 RepID=UPI002582BCCF|nr:hypothetical protein [Pseudomonas sp.]